APEATGRLAILLVDEDLLGRAPAAATDLDGQLSARQPGCDRRIPDRVGGAAWQDPAGQLELDLERLEDLGHEPPRPVAQGGRVGRERQVQERGPAQAGTAAAGRAISALDWAFARSFRICAAASLPGAPMTQPPGCVPEPHW